MLIKAANLKKEMFKVIALGFVLLICQYEKQDLKNTI